MSDFAPALTADQWDRIRQIVHDEALRARVAASFLPLYGPIPGAAAAVPVDILSYEPLSEPIDPSLISAWWSMTTTRFDWRACR